MARLSERIFVDTISISHIPSVDTFILWLTHGKLLHRILRLLRFPYLQERLSKNAPPPGPWRHNVATRLWTPETSESEKKSENNGNAILVAVRMGLLIHGMAASCWKSCTTTLRILLFRGVSAPVHIMKWHEWWHGLAFARKRRCWCMYWWLVFFCGAPANAMLKLYNAPDALSPEITLDPSGYLNGVLYAKLCWIVYANANIRPSCTQSCACSYEQEFYMGDQLSFQFVNHSG